MEDPTQLKGEGGAVWVEEPNEASAHGWSEDRGRAPSLKGLVSVVRSFVLNSDEDLLKRFV